MEPLKTEQESASASKGFINKGHIFYKKIKNTPLSLPVTNITKIDS